MKTALAVFFLSSLISMSAHSAQLASSADAELQQKLVAMGAADQAVRDKLTPFLKTGDLKSEGFKAVAQEMASIDAHNLAELEKMIDAHGWPDVDRVGVDASNSAFLILQHSPLDAKKRLLPKFRDAVAAGKARGADLAMLEDRIRIGEGKKQLYGTQVTAGPDGMPRLDPIEEPSGLDVRRKAVGLPPIDEYLKHIETQIGRPIDRSALNSEKSP